MKRNLFISFCFGICISVFAKPLSTSLARLPFPLPGFLHRRSSYPDQHGGNDQNQNTMVEMIKVCLRILLRGQSVMGLKCVFTIGNHVKECCFFLSVHQAASIQLNHPDIGKKPLPQKSVFFFGNLPTLRRRAQSWHRGVALEWDISSWLSPQRRGRWSHTAEKLSWWW